jgi:hypothetical protein
MFRGEMIWGLRLVVSETLEEAGKRRVMNKTDWT